MLFLTQIKSFHQLISFTCFLSQRNLFTCFLNQCVLYEEGGKDVVADEQTEVVHQPYDSGLSSLSRIRLDTM